MSSSIQRFRSRVDRSSSFNATSLSQMEASSAMRRMACGKPPVSMTIRVFDQLFQRIIGQGQVKSEELANAPHVNVADRQPTSRRRLQNPQKRERLGCLPHADPADPELLGKLVLGRQSIARLEGIVDDVIPYPVGHLLGQFFTLNHTVF